MRRAEELKLYLKVNDIFCPIQKDFSLLLTSYGLTLVDHNNNKNNNYNNYNYNNRIGLLNENTHDECVSTKLRVAVNHVCLHLVTQFYTPLYTNVY